MEIDLFTYSCSGCGKCVENCPCGALIIRDNGFCRFANVVDENLCSGCKICEKRCPYKAIRIITVKREKFKD